VEAPVVEATTPVEVIAAPEVEVARFAKLSLKLIAANLLRWLKRQSWPQSRLLKPSLKP
jgi:hypothetical protein